MTDHERNIEDNAGASDGDGPRVRIYAVRATAPALSGGGDFHVTGEANLDARPSVEAHAGVAEARVEAFDASVDTHEDVVGSEALDLLRDLTGDEDFVRAAATHAVRIYLTPWDSGDGGHTVIYVDGERTREADYSRVHRAFVYALSDTERAMRQE